MRIEYFSLPLALDRVMRQRELPKCTLQTSITQHLHLLITTSFGEFPSDDRFGCGIWDHDFDNVSSPHKLKELVRQSLLEVVEDQEKRLKDIRVELMIVQEEVPEAEGLSRIKKRISVSITGTLKSTNERITFRDSFFVGPLSY